MKKRISCLLLCLLLIWCLCGCVKTVQLNERAIVEAIGIDYQNGAYVVTLRLLDPNDPDAEGFLSVSEGETILDAIDHANRKQGREIFYNHNNLLVVGQQAAETGLTYLTGLMDAAGHARPNTSVVLARGKASEVIAVSAKEGLSAKELDTAIENEEKSGAVLKAYLIDVAKRLNDGSGSFLLPTVSANEDSLMLDGVGLVKGGKLAGFLNTDDLRGYLWLAGNLEDAVFTASDEEYGNFTLAIKSSKGEIVPTLQDGKLGFSMKVTVKAHIPILKNGEEIAQDREKQQKLMATAELAIQNELLHTLDLFQKKNADVFRLEERLSQRYPKEQEARRKVEGPTVFQLPTKITVSVHFIGL